MSVLVLPGCRPQKDVEARDVVLIVIDTLRADHLALYGYGLATSPNLERLAADSVTYTQAISPGTWTVPVHASLFTGLWPSFHGAERVAGDRNLALPMNPEVPTLAELVRAHGLRTAAFVANATYVSPIFGFGRGFDEFFDAHLDRGPQVSKAIGNWLATQQGRVFLFVNILDPHEPYDPPPPFDTHFPGKHEEFGAMMTTLLFAGAPLTPEMRAHFASQYDGEVAVADQAVGAIIAGMKKRGRYDQALVIVTSDHGEFLGEHGLAGHGQPPFEPEVHVPLLVKYPFSRRAGERVARRVSTLGIFSTILSTLRVPAPPDTQAQPLDDPHPVWVEDIDQAGNRIRVAYDDRQKLISATTATGTENRLYDLAADPGESTPIRDGSEAATLRAVLTSFADAPRPVNMAERPVMDPEREAKLRALGYIR